MLLAKVIQNVKKLNTSMVILSGFNRNMQHVVKHDFAALNCNCGGGEDVMKNNPCIIMRIA